MNKNKLRLNYAANTLGGTLVQLNYLSELIDKLNMTDKQREQIVMQVHNIKVNSRGAMTDIASVNVGMIPFSETV
ncbi:hypothetical protein [Lactobacillus plantarum] [Lactiplantibacillus mudanjiangensis]|uniref:hypothetical protein n=1 Tax=Lactiplantibacillus mudanjiangensis TaxID=1296538 RepID=UPI00101589D1|nr:hypothetical protein [Lactiplantibacillus mudanjiangensis]VDG31333.1 hypothetical protein [Lactobacillus plantarum] [Lactiplantibacillus mudanjiangensis]